MADKQLLDKVKLTVGLSLDETAQDDYINLLLDDATEYIVDLVVSLTSTTYGKKQLTKDVVKSLGYVIRAISVSMYNRRGDEGMSETGINQFTKSYLTMDKLIAPYLDAINQFAEEFNTKEPESNVTIQGTFMFL